jgi:hypothetical protein
MASLMDGVIFDITETKSRTCCISFDGLKMLHELNMMGEALPKGWQSHVWEYLRRRSRNMQKKQEEFQKIKKQYTEAVAIARCLHTEKTLER